MHNLRIALFGVCLTACSGSAPPEPAASVDELNTAIDEWLRAHPEGFQLTIDRGQLEVSCPKDVDCARERDMWPVKTGHHDLYISFSGGVVDDFTLRGLREHFSYVSMELELLEQQRWKVELDANVVSRTEDGHVTIESFDKGRMRMLVKRQSTNLWAKLDAPHCTPPEDAPLPADCAVSRQVKIPIEVRIDLDLSTPRAR